VSSLIVVFDTNVLLPLLVGSTRRAKGLRQAWQNQQFELFVTPQMLMEVKRVLTYPQVQHNYGLTLTEVETIIDILKGRARLLLGLYTDVTAILVDLSDNVFLAASMESGADYLVTQDAHLLNLKYYHGTQIISLAQFAQLLGIE